MQVLLALDVVGMACILHTYITQQNNEHTAYRGGGGPWGTQVICCGVYTTLRVQIKESIQ